MRAVAICLGIVFTLVFLRSEVEPTHKYILITTSILILGTTRPMSGFAYAAWSIHFAVWALLEHSMLLDGDQCGWLYIPYGIAGHCFGIAALAALISKLVDRFNKARVPGARRLKW